MLHKHDESKECELDTDLVCVRILEMAPVPPPPPPPQRSVPECGLRFKGGT